MNMVSSKTATATAAAGGGSTAADLTILIRAELDFVRESFRQAKQNMDQLITQTDRAFDKFDELLMLPEPGEARATDLQLLKASVSKLKSKIPFILITPSSNDLHHYGDPNLHWRPRSSLPNSCFPLNSTTVVNFSQPPTSVELASSVASLTGDSQDCLRCFLVFPENVLIKRSLLFYWAKAHSSADPIVAIGDCIRKGFINPVYKIGNLGLNGYWMHPSVRSALNNGNLIPQPACSPHLLRSFDMEDDIIYSDNFEESVTEKGMKRFLHLGKWQKSSKQYFEQHNERNFEQHIEVVEPEVFFKDMEKLYNLRYVSLGGISMITELPDFVTKLDCLEVLDLKACYHLEVIPPSIANLSRSLTHLDMSECYFLDQMPMALASLHSLKILKGFYVGGTTKKDSCSLHHLVALQGLRKLNIYTSVTEFPNEEQLTTLQEFKSLRNLTISWGGCSVLSETEISRLAVIAATRHRGFLKRMGTSVGDNKEFSFMLEKLDLQCVPETVTRSWLNPSNFKQLKKLYIRGGLFYDLGQLWDNQESEEPVLKSHWKVEILRLKHLSKLEMDWPELERIFPSLKCVEKVRCPNLNGFPCDDNGFFMKETQLYPYASC